MINLNEPDFDKINPIDAIVNLTNNESDIRSSVLLNLLEFDPTVKQFIEFLIFVIEHNLNLKAVTTLMYSNLILLRESYKRDNIEFDIEHCWHVSLNSLKLLLNFTGN